MSECVYPDLSPSYGYKLGCRCAERCAAWRRAKDLEHRERLNAYKREQRQQRAALVMPAPTAVEPKPGRSTTTFYNDVLDWWAGL